MTKLNKLRELKLDVMCLSYSDVLLFQALVMQTYYWYKIMYRKFVKEIKILAMACVNYPQIAYGMKHLHNLTTIIRGI